jgi:hypothetical protein
MSTRNGSKINQLITGWPRGTVCTQPYLTARGFDPNLMRRYRKSRWIQSIGSGAYMMQGDTISWHGALYALQEQLSLPVHAGGSTALELLGFSHYARFLKNTVFIFAPQKTVLPKWFRSPPWQPAILLRNTNLLPFDISESFTKAEHRDFTICISTAERAIFEMLYDVPRLQGFDEADKIFESLMTLRPRLVQRLLEQCNSIKVKRLLLLMAEHHQLPWFEEISMEKIDLGQGKRMLIKNGQLHPKYRITVPRGYGADA